MGVVTLSMIFFASTIGRFEPGCVQEERFMAPGPDDTMKWGHRGMDVGRVPGVRAFGYGGDRPCGRTTRV